MVAHPITGPETLPLLNRLEARRGEVVLCGICQWRLRVANKMVNLQRRFGEG